MTRPIPTTLLDVAQTAQKLGVSRRTVWRLRDRGALPAIKLGAAVRWSDAAIDQWIADGCRPTPKTR